MKTIKKKISLAFVKKNFTKIQILQSLNLFYNNHIHTFYLQDKSKAPFGDHEVSRMGVNGHCTLGFFFLAAKYGGINSGWCIYGRNHPHLKSTPTGFFFFFIFWL
jgi:hypothetical protein